MPAAGKDRAIRIVGGRPLPVVSLLKNSHANPKPEIHDP
jgi:hypothetical protein